MNKLIFFSGFFCLLFSFNQSKSQDFENEINLKQDNFGLYLNGQASTNGLGFNFNYILNRRFSFRAGYETLQVNRGFNFNENDISYDANIDYKTGGLFLLADYYYTTRLYISGGIGINNFNPIVTGKAVSNLQYGDISIPSADIGEFNFSLEPSSKVSPYIGAGVRSFMGKENRITFNFETGLYYMGAPNIDIQATGLLSPTAAPEHGQKAKLEEQIEQYKIYPVIKFSLGIKLF